MMGKVPFLTLGNEKGRLFDGFDETNKQTPERSYKILKKDRSFCARKNGASQVFAVESVKRGVRISPVAKITRKYLFF
jgi:hypothetical protein